MEHNPPLRAGLEIVAAPGGSAAWLVDGTHVLSRAYGSRVLQIHLPLQALERRDTRRVAAPQEKGREDASVIKIVHGTLRAYRIEG